MLLPKPRNVNTTVGFKAMTPDDAVVACCADCGRLYSDPGFPDLVIPNDAWREISPTGNEGGLLCPSCICGRLDRAEISCVGAFMSGPIESVSRTLMGTMRKLENLEERVAHDPR